MERQYLIMIDAKKAHQPSSDEIFSAVKKLVDNRVNQFPTKHPGGTGVTLVPKNLPRRDPQTKE